MSSPLREILVAFGFEIDKKQEEQIVATVEKLKKLAIGLGVAFGAKQAVDFVTETVAAVANLGDEVGETAQKLGVNAKALQTLGFVAKDSGASMQDMGTAMRFISKNAVAAADGNKDMIENFSKLGVSVRDSNGQLKTADQLFVELADGFVNVKDPAERTALAMKVLGRSGTQLIPTMLKGSDALREQAKAAEELGFVMGDDLLDASDKYMQAQSEQEGAVQGLKVAFSTKLIPVLEKVTRAFTKLLVKMQPVAAAIGKMLAGALTFVSRLLTGFGQALGSIAGIFQRLGFGLSMLVAGITALGVAFAFVGKSGIIAGLKIAAAWILANAPLALMILLVGIIIGAILLLIEDFVAMGEGAESVTGTMIQGFMDLVDQVGSIPGAIWEMLKTALDFWIEFFTGAKDATSRFIQWFVDIMSGAWDKVKGIAGFVSGAVGSIGGAFGITSSSVGGSPSAGASGTSVSHGGTNIDMKIDASGSAASAADIGSEVAKHVEAVTERQNRELVQAFAVGG